MIMMRPILLLVLTAISSKTTSQLLPEDDPSIDYYCGINWKEANTYCNLPCPSGNNTDCPPNNYGRSRQCYASSGCASRTETLSWYGILSVQFDREAHLQATNGATMSDAEAAAFGESVMGLLTAALQDTIEVDCVEVMSQEYDRPCVGAVIPRYLQTDDENNTTTLNDYYCGVSWMDASEKCNYPCPSMSDTDCPAISSGQNTSCFAATGCSSKQQLPSSTSLDLEVKMCGIYIPEIGEELITPSDFENDIINIVTTREKQIVNVVASSSDFFHAITGIAALANDAIAEAPSSMPSDAPTRPGDVAIETYIDAKPTGSYGLLFSVRTNANISTVLLTGMSFVTPHDGLVEYEVYTRLGSWDDYEGVLSAWDLLARGQTTGRGPVEFTPVLNEVPEDDDLGFLGFSPVHIPGDGGMRSFYVTLTKTFTMEDKVAVPIYFSSSLVEENEGLANYATVTINEELEILEGDGVLEYPAPSNRNGESDLFYRRPRGFIGAFEYTREPCYPTLDFYGWPCPYVPKEQQTNNPTAKPVALTTVGMNTQKPTPAPTRAITKTPTREKTESNSTVAGSQHVNGDIEGGPVKENDANNGFKVLTLHWRQCFITFLSIILINI